MRPEQAQLESAIAALEGQRVTLGVAMSEGDGSLDGGRVSRRREVRSPRSSLRTAANDSEAALKSTASESSSGRGWSSQAWPRAWWRISPTRTSTSAARVSSTARAAGASDAVGGHRSAGVQRVAIGQRLCCGGRQPVRRAVRRAVDRRVVGGYRSTGLQ